MKEINDMNMHAAVKNAADKAAQGMKSPAHGQDSRAGSGGKKAKILENDLCAALEMLFELIFLHRKETELKKSHKAYLHVREEMDKLCERDLELAEIILDHYASFAKESTFNCAREPMADCGNGETASGRKDEMILMPVRSIRNMMNDIIVMAESRSRLTEFIMSMLSGNSVSKEVVDQILSKEEETDARILGHVDDGWLTESENGMDAY